MRSLLAVLILASPVAATAACPTFADLNAGGVKVTYEDGTTARFLSEREGYVIEETKIDADDDGFWVESWLGAYQVGVSDMKNGERLRDGGIFAIYSVPLSDIPKPAPNVSWSNEFLEVDENGAELGRLDVAIDFGRERSIQIGACNYDAIDMEVVTLGPGDDDVGRFLYLRELGIAVVVAEGVLTREGLTLDKYTPVSIAAADRP